MRVISPPGWKSIAWFLEMFTWWKTASSFLAKRRGSQIAKRFYLRMRYWNAVRRIVSTSVLEVFLEEVDGLGVDLLRLAFPLDMLEILRFPALKLKFWPSKICPFGKYIMFLHPRKERGVEVKVMQLCIILISSVLSQTMLGRGVQKFNETLAESIFLIHVLSL